MIAFNMEKAEAVDTTGRHVFTDYEELREWCNEEDKTDHSWQTSDQTYKLSGGSEAKI